MRSTEERESEQSVRVASVRSLVNLFSDTQTLPTAGMRRAIAAAEVGDEQLMADPTVNRLCERVSALVAFEAAVFLPSGTMCNEIAIRVHVRPGDALFLHRTAHVLRYEAGAPAALSGAVLVPLEGSGGMFDAATLGAAIPASPDRFSPRPRLVSVEQTTNLAGGRVWPLQQVRDVLDVARRHDMRAHLDGARLMNAAVASGVAPAEWCRGFDTAWIDFTKGLGAPFGAVLAGSNALIDEVWRYKQMMGGAMRQAGMMAAGALYALDHHVDRLADDHANARRLAEGLADVLSITVDPDAVETNIVLLTVRNPQSFLATLAERGVLMSQIGPTTVRAVTHLDIGPDEVARAITAARDAVRA
jgi:threonine aldolase